MRVNLLPGHDPLPCQAPGDQVCDTVSSGGQAEEAAWENIILMDCREEDSEDKEDSFAATYNRNNEDLSPPTVLCKPLYCDNKCTPSKFASSL